MFACVRQNIFDCQACSDAFSYFKVCLRMGYFAGPTVLLVVNQWLYYLCHGFLILIIIATYLRKPTQLRGNHEYVMRGLEALSHHEDLHFEYMAELKSVHVTKAWGHESTDVILKKRKISKVLLPCHREVCPL